MIDLLDLPHLKYGQAVILNNEGWRFSASGFGTGPAIVDSVDLLRGRRSRRFFFLFTSIISCEGICNFLMDKSWKKSIWLKNRSIFQLSNSFKIPNTFKICHTWTSCCGDFRCRSASRRLKICPRKTLSCNSNIFLSNPGSFCNNICKFNCLATPHMMRKECWVLMVNKSLPFSIRFLTLTLNN